MVEENVSVILEGLREFGKSQLQNCGDKTVLSYGN
jgi:hypothetical protein